MSTVTDFIAIKRPYCHACAERKLGCQILGSWPLDNSEYVCFCKREPLKLNIFRYKRFNTTSVDAWNETTEKIDRVQLSLRGCAIKCECVKPVKSQK